MLPEIISKEPLGPFVRQGDDPWLNIVQWSLFAMIGAEEYGVTSQNVDEQLKSANPNIKCLLGELPGSGASMGLDDKWAYNIVKQVGNYSEIFEANVGVNTALGLPRGVNAQWYKGGLMFASPFR